MKKKILASLTALAIVFGIAVTVFPISRAAVVPYFISVNDTLLPFNENNMPLFQNGTYLIPANVLPSAGVFVVDAVSDERVMLSRGTRFVIFYVRQEVMIDQDGNLSWAPAHRTGNRFYVPLTPVASHFGLTYEIIRRDDIIPNTRVSVIRINPNQFVNAESFIGLHSDAIRDSYNRHFNAANQTDIAPPDDDIPPSFADVTVYLSFYNLSAGSTEEILGILSNAGFLGTFFASADDIVENPGLVRRIAGSGHTVGIWIQDGIYYEEYQSASDLLFEAAKLTTVLVATNLTLEPEELPSNLVVWDSMQSSGNITAASVINALPTTSGARHGVRFNCSENTAAILPGVLSHLRESDYTVVPIVETAEPI